LVIAKIINNVKKYEVSNQRFINDIKYLEKDKFPLVILITCNDEKCLIIECDSRMIVYGYDFSKLEGTCADIGYCILE
jgi:hypothetical protein